MKNLLVSLLILSLYGCTAYQSKESATPSQVSACLGTTELPVHLAASFAAIDDPELLASALGEPEKGKLCQGQVYQSKDNASVVFYRAWNSTNPNSQFGQWWAFKEPAGKVASYRSNYEICYQWSPLDKMVKCTLKPNTKVVVGTGQSATCSDYLSYPVSDQQQIYIENASEVLMNCAVLDGVFSWQAL